MPARIDPFVDVLLREGGDQLYLLPDEPVTMVKDGKPRKVSRQPLTDQHIYALLVEVAPTASTRWPRRSSSTWRTAGWYGCGSYPRAGGSRRWSRRSIRQRRRKQWSR